MAMAPDLFFWASCVVGEAMMNGSFECFDHESAVQQIAGSLSCAIRQVDAAVGLLETGNTIPFIPP